MPTAAFKSNTRGRASRRSPLLTAVCGSLTAVVCTRGLFRFTTGLEGSALEADPTFVSYKNPLHLGPYPHVRNLQRVARAARGGEEGDKAASKLCRELFDAMDYDHDGFVRRIESVTLSRAFGEDQSRSEHTWTEMLSALDRDGDGAVSTDEYVQFWLTNTGDKGKIDAKGDFIPEYADYIEGRIKAVSSKVDETRELIELPTAVAGPGSFNGFVAKAVPVPPAPAKQSATPAAASNVKSGSSPPSPDLAAASPPAATKAAAPSPPPPAEAPAMASKEDKPKTNKFLNIPEHVVGGTSWMML